MEIKKIFIAGAGIMGGGIAQVAAQGGLEVILYDIAQSGLDKALETISWSVGKLVSKGKVQGSAEEIVGRITKATSLEAAKDADFVVEVIPEVLQLKRDLFAKLEDIVRPQVVIATNTSALPITEIATGMKRPDKIVGTHFFSPVPMMNMVELVRGMETSDETLEIAKDFAKAINKEFIVVNKDVAGFVMNRIGICSTIEAIRILEEGIATAEDIDKGMRFAYGWAMGPIETFDMTGIDSATHAAQAIFDESQDSKFLPPVTLRRLLASGNLGRKTGKGFYDYSKK